MQNKNIAITWNWEYDEDFVVAIEQECAKRDISTLRIDEKNLHEIIDHVERGSYSFDVLFDRASDSDTAFVPLVNVLQQHSTRIFNNYYLAERARDKTTMHLELMTAGLFVPHSLIIPPFASQQFLFLTEKEVAELGSPFVIKPANTTGGGFGVHVNGTSLMNIHVARQEHPYDKYMIQEFLHPKIINEKRAWFRVLYAFGEVIPCWWDDTTHVYTEVTAEEEFLFELSTLRNYMHTIQKVCKLDFFSSEIVLTKEHQFVVIDYVNEVCDMRLQSKSVDGVPDDIVERIVTLLVNEIEITHQRSEGID